MTVIEATRPAKTPGTKTPGAKTPGTKTPGTATPATQTPGTATPATATPATGTPATGTRPAPARRPALVRRARLVALAVGAFLLPWCALLAVTLPSSARAGNWSLAWTGLDGAEAIAALATAALLTRSDPRASLTAAAGGALLFTDAWFDVCTSAPGPDQWLAVTEAVFVELPLAAAAFWLAATLLRRNG
jgi:hypothetical protein